MVMVAVCERFGWDFHTYLAQPTWFLDLLLYKIEVDAKKAEQEQRRLSTQS